LGYREVRTINELILHCSASRIYSYDFRAIKKDHLRRGWDDIGYHYGIDFEADIHILRPVNKVGAHVKGHNKHSIGICILGLDHFTTRQLKQAGRLCTNLCHLLGLNQKAIRCHYEFTDQKTCPNFDIELFKKHYVRDC